MINKNDIVNLIKKKKFKFEIDKQNDLITFVVPVKDRKQKCSAKIKKHEQFGDMVEIFSVIGQFDPSDLENALKTSMILLVMNEDLLYAKTELQKDNDKMSIVARTIAASADENEIEAMILEVAIYADILEDKLLGKDVE